MIRWPGWLVATALAVFLAGCGNDTAGVDPASLRPYVDRYVALLDSKDESSLRPHLGNDAQPRDAADRITAYGGQGWRVSDVTWTAFTEMATRTVFTVIIKADGTGGPTSWSEVIGWENEHWVMRPLNPVSNSDSAGTVSPARP